MKLFKIMCTVDDGMGFCGDCYDRPYDCDNCPSIQRYEIGKFSDVELAKEAIKDIYESIMKKPYRKAITCENDDNVYSLDEYGHVEFECNQDCDECQWAYEHENRSCEFYAEGRCSYSVTEFETYEDYNIGFSIEVEEIDKIGNFPEITLLKGLEGSYKKEIEE